MPDKRRNQLQDTINNFYQKPIAKVSLELFLSLGAIIFFAFFAIRPTLLTMSDLIKEIEDKRELDGKLTQKIASLSTAQTQYMQLEDRIVLLDQAIPSNIEMIKTLKTIEKIASEQDLAITQLSTSEVPDTEEGENIPFNNTSLQQLSVSIAVTGDYQSIRQFVEGIRKSRRSLVVDTVSFQVEGLRGAKQLNANITIAAPYFGVKSSGVAK